MGPHPHVPVRDAATVVLLRDGDAGIEAWLLTRVREMAFAAGMSVFPGGRVDPDDAGLPFPGGAGAEVARRFGCALPAARAYLGAAVRETFEETGVLMTTPAADLSGARPDVEAGRVSFGDLLRANGLRVDADALRPWSRWITPPGESRRYDTVFFVAALPADARAQDVTTESATAGWVPVAEAVEQAQRGERGLLPPTIVTLASIMAFATVADVLAASPQRSLEAISPAISVRGDRIVATLPDGTDVTLPAGLFR
ncbi:MAG: NUDIX domain-containing protein [Jatrophihabitans sp.]|nr:MAG: NUDIX domain-containing protein [Jatrophihabitans sp.]